MKIKKAINRLFNHNEIVALWFETDQHFKVLLWRGEAWKLSEEYKKLRIAKFFGTMPQTISQAGTINILIKSKPVQVGCATCIHRGTMDCPNSAKCFSLADKPFWEWNESMWNERKGV